MTSMGDERRSGGDRRNGGTATMTRPARESRLDREIGPDRGEFTRGTARPRSFVAPGLLLGIGIGGLLDGIVFHRLLNWHHLLSDDQPMTGDGLTDNLFADGVFDLIALVILVLGLALLWGSWRRTDGGVTRGSGVRLTGWMLVGWALFNIVEGAVNHLVLDLHHVNETADSDTILAWDIGFLAASVVVGIIGLAMAMRRSDERVAHRTGERPVW